MGVDPGSHRTGWGLLAGDIHNPVLVDCGEIRLPEGEPLPRRLDLLRRRFEALLSELRPDVAAVESPFHGASARSALQLAHARGVLLASLSASGIEVVEHTPAAIKKAVTGNGRADKSQVQRMVVSLLRTEAAGASADLADAIAAALCEIAVGGFREAVERGSRRPQPARR